MRYPLPPYAERREFHRPFWEALSAEIERIKKRVLVHQCSICGRRSENMPPVTLTVRKLKSAEFKTSVLDAIHAALIAFGVPETDRFQRVIELDAEDFRFDASFSDVASPRA